MLLLPTHMTAETSANGRALGATGPAGRRQETSTTGRAIGARQETSTTVRAIGATGPSERRVLSSAVYRHNRFQLPAAGSWLNVTQVQEPFIVVQYRVGSDYFQLEIDLRSARFVRTFRGGTSAPGVNVRSSPAPTPPAVQTETRSRSRTPGPNGPR